MEWLENDKTQNRTQFDGEVIVQYEKHADNKRVLFKFRKNSIHKIATDCKYIVVARDDGRIYFKESDNKHGFKLGDYGLNVKSFKIDLRKFPVDENDLGEYNLEFDTKLGLHYICLNRKLEKTLCWEGKY